MEDKKRKHMDHKGGSSNDAKDVELVLKTYLELFNSSCDFFKYLIAPNGVLEWFGRTIKGNQKIHDFLKYEVRSQYDHLCFDTIKSCEPIECKPSHMGTKDFPVGESGKTIYQNAESSLESDTTFLDIQAPATPSTRDRHVHITPPSSAKRFKHDDHQNTNQSGSTLLNLDDYFDRKETPIQAVSSAMSISYTVTSRSQTKTENGINCGYSELRYLTAIGVLRSSVQPEFRSFRNSTVLNGNDVWDRETKIQISYRTRLRDNDIQFALVVYQNARQLSAVSKRNLMSEFEEVAMKEELEKSGGTTKMHVRQSPPVKRKIGRRLRLL